MALLQRDEERIQYVEKDGWTHNVLDADPSIESPVEVERRALSSTNEDEDNQIIEV